MAPSGSARRGKEISLAAGSVLFALGACAPATKDAEVANIYPRNVIPKSSAAQLTDTFRRICLADGPEARQEALRTSDYVPVQSGRRDVQSYVVDNRKPAVMISDGDRGCAVAAEPRTGQTNRIADFVASTFPGATAIDPKRIGNRVESAWATPEGDVIFLQRHGPRIAPPRLIFGISRAHTNT